MVFSRLFIFTIVIMFFFTSLNAQNKIDSTATVDNKLKLHDKKFNDFEIENKLMSQKIDSLQNELYKYKLNESYFSTALSSQTTIFSLIVAGLLGLAGFIAWGGYRFQVMRLRKEFREKIKQQSSEFEKLKKGARTLERKLVLTMARVDGVIANTIEDPPTSLLFSLYAAREWYNSYLISIDENQKESSLEALSSNLKNSKSVIDEIAKDEKYLEIVKEDRPIILHELSEISKIVDNEKIIDLCAEIRIAINAYVKLDAENDYNNVEPA